MLHNRGGGELIFFWPPPFTFNIIYFFVSVVKERWGSDIGRVMKSISNTAARRIVKEQNLYLKWKDTKWLWSSDTAAAFYVEVFHSWQLYDLSFSSQSMNSVTPLSNDHLRMLSWSASGESSQDPFIIRDAPLESSRNCPAHCQLATLHSSEWNFSRMRIMLIL